MYNYIVIDALVRYLAFTSSHVTLRSRVLLITDRRTRHKHKGIVMMIIIIIIIIMIIDQ